MTRHVDPYGMRVCSEDGISKMSDKEVSTGFAKLAGDVECNSKLIRPIGNKEIFSKEIVNYVYCVLPLPLDEVGSDDDGRFKRGEWSSGDAFGPSAPLS